MKKLSQWDSKIQIGLLQKNTLTNSYDINRNNKYFQWTLYKYKILPFTLEFDNSEDIYFNVSWFQKWLGADDISSDVPSKKIWLYRLLYDQQSMRMTVFQLSIYDVSNTSQDVVIIQYQIIQLKQVAIDPNHFYGHCNKQLYYHGLVTGILDSAKFQFNTSHFVMFFQSNICIQLQKVIDDYYGYTPGTTHAMY